ncbi:MAG: tyrosine-type recombinase/integrase [Proteobacteria bacterium]|nr:tyrosine-type recombinase/integrase [Pseudomonadota bacterium]
MTTHNAKNERIKRKYFAYLKEAIGHGEPTVDAVAKALNRFEVYGKHRDFQTFHSEQAVGFKKHLAEQKAKLTGEKLSKATLHSTLSALKQFFQWLSRETGYKSRIHYSEADFFNLSEKDTRIATAKREQRSPTMSQIKHVIASMPASTEIERRNRAIVAFTLLTGARDNAIKSAKLKHIDLLAGSFYQDARDVQTKFSKTFITTFFPVGDEILEIVVDWVNYLRDELLWGNDDPVFPSTRREQNSSYLFEIVGIDRKHWSNATPIRTIFKKAFTNAGLPYFNPHSFRHTLVRLGQTVCQSPEDFKAWSQNLGHDKVLTTFLSYGQVESTRQGEIIRGLAAPQFAMQPDVSKLARALVREMRDSEAAGGII